MDKYWRYAQELGCMAEVLNELNESLARYESWMAQIEERRDTTTDEDEFAQLTHDRDVKLGVLGGLKLAIRAVEGNARELLWQIAYHSKYENGEEG